MVVKVWKVNSEWSFGWTELTAWQYVVMGGVGVVWLADRVVKSMTPATVGVGCVACGTGCQVNTVVRAYFLY